MIAAQPTDAISYTDEVIATQRRCHEKISWYYNSDNGYRVT